MSIAQARRPYLYCKEAKRVAHHGGKCFRLSRMDVILRRRGCNYQVSELPPIWTLPRYLVYRVC